MKFDSRYLDQPTCVFGNGSECRGGDERFKGLRLNGPYESKEVPDVPKFLFVFPTEYRHYANSLFHGLRNGSNQFPGINAMFGIKFDTSSVDRCAGFTVEGRTSGSVAIAYSSAIQQHIFAGNKPDIAIVICEKTRPDQYDSAYYSAKSTLTSHGIPSQTVTLDVLSRPSQLNWALADIALQLFVKLGGHPWHVKPSPGGGDVVVGIGKSERIDHTGKLRRVVGFTTCYSAGGIFRNVEVFQPHRTLSSYLEGLEGSVKSALENIPVTDAPMRLVLHVPKRFSRVEEEKVEAALRAMPNKVAGYVVLRVNTEHPFLLFDLAHQTYVPPSGMSVELDAKNRLLLMEGRPKAGNLRRPPPAPLWVSLQKACAIDASLDALVQQIHDLSVANWRGFNAKAKPITIYYSSLLARILAATDSDEVIEAISKNARIRNVPWFI